jgi:transcriptional regulator with XRE-family HTH domain
LDEEKYKDLLNKVIGKELRIRRKRQKLTLEDLAGLSNVSRNHISGIERGNTTMSVYVQAKIAKGLKLSDPSELTSKAFKNVYPSMPDYTD